jgi:hypothetical protein
MVHECRSNRPCMMTVTGSGDVHWAAESPLAHDMLRRSLEHRAASAPWSVVQSAIGDERQARQSRVLGAHAWGVIGVRWLTNGWLGELAQRGAHALDRRAECVRVVVVDVQRRSHCGDHACFEKPRRLDFVAGESKVLYLPSAECFVVVACEHGLFVAFDWHQLKLLAQKRCERQAKG